MSTTSNVALTDDFGLTYKDQIVCFLDRTCPHSARYYINGLRNITLEEKKELVALVLKYYASLESFFLASSDDGDDW